MGYIFIVLRISCSIAFAFLLFSVASAQTPIIVNQYAAVTAFPSCDACISPCSRAVVDDASIFSIGDEALLIQMKGADIVWTDTPQFGTITSYGSAGFHELLTIASINLPLNEVTFSTPIAGNYVVAGRVQLVRKFRVVGNYTVPIGGVTCAPWDGEKGGVLFMEVTGTLSLTGDIDVTGKGFRGAVNLNSNNDITRCGTGGPAGNDFANGIYAFDAQHVQWSGRKGEGIAEFRSPQFDLGRAPLANGGGGGLNHNSGGGGGANMGAGGMGGNPYGNYSAAICGVVTNGMGGYVLDRMGGLRMFMGGGGGSGQENNNRGNSGGDGGGIILLRANQIQGNNRRIISDGFIGFNYAGVEGGLGGNDGGGGGGAGGSIKIECANFGLTALTIQARGGNGGSLDAIDHGPGGGGGGGLICFSAASITNPLVSVVSTGGNSGLLNDGTANGAQPGQVGITAYSCSSISVNPPRTLSISIGPDLVLCNPAEGTLTTSLAPSGYTFTWFRNGSVQVGATGPSLIVNQNGTYVVRVVNALCSAQDTAIVTRTGTEIPQNQTFCDDPTPVPVTLQVGNPTVGANYGWFRQPNGPLLSIGTSYTIPNLNRDTVLYVIDTNKVRVTIGPTPVGGSQVYYQGNASSQDITIAEHHRTFQVTAPIVLRSVQVRAALNIGGCGWNNTFTRPVTITLFQNGAPTTQTRTATIGCDVLSTVPLMFTIPPGTNYELRIVGLTPGQFYLNAQSSGFSIPSILSISPNYAQSGSFYNWFIEYGNPCAPIPVYATRNCPLPVQFIHTSAELLGADWNIQWTVVDEKDIQYYVVESSSDGISFTSIGQIPATRRHQYQWNGAIPADQGYFRIRAVEETNPIHTYSAIHPLNKPTNPCLTVYPNPIQSSSKMVLMSDIQQTIEIELFSSLGIRVKKWNWPVEPGLNSKIVDVEDLSSGIYFIQYKNEHEKSCKLKLIYTK
ncbi:MAG: T9SS type A sorting domain-containing protein [Cytophagaceae bacterium]|jgi:hypothetical protein|nr:T9SS type A sorting domain-containing protein [Cytophagaceae bacterium]